MSKTNDLRKVIYTRLNGLLDEYPIKEVSYRLADDVTMFPHIVYDIDSISLTDERDDVIVNVDIFDKDNKRIEDIADDVVALFKAENVPQETILPTFYFDSRRNLPDEDKTIRHINIRFTSQYYER